jgi:hypothetical protein
VVAVAAAGVFVDVAGLHTPFMVITGSLGDWLASTALLFGAEVVGAALLGAVLAGTELFSWPIAKLDNSRNRNTNRIIFGDSSTNLDQDIEILAQS